MTVTSTLTPDYDDLAIIDKVIKDTAAGRCLWLGWNGSRSTLQAEYDTGIAEYDVSLLGNSLRIIMRGSRDECRIALKVTDENRIKHAVLSFQQNTKLNMPATFRKAMG